MNPIISASILSADFSNLASEIRNCEQASVDWLHVDVMDNQFVPNLTMGPFIVKTCRKISNLPLDCHLMVKQPEKLVASFAEAGANNITIHPEDNPNTYRTLQYIRSLGCCPGIALNPETSLAVLSPLLSLVDMVLVMTVHAGFSGQIFMQEIIEKVKDTSLMIRQLGKPIRLEVDGGITPETISQVLGAGADTFVSATSIFNAPGGISAGVKNLKNGLLK